MRKHVDQPKPGILHPNASNPLGRIPASSSRPRWSTCLLMLGIAWTILSCATSSGSAYDSSVEGEGSAAARAAEAKKERQTQTPTPTNDQGWPYTENQNRPSQISYYNTYNKSPTIMVSIIAPTGSLLVHGAPSGAELLVDGLPRGLFSDGGSSTQAKVTMEAGQHRVRVEHFGYSSWESEVYVSSNSLTSLQADLKPIPFSLRASNPRDLLFDPARPGRSGTLVASFSATAPGTATATVLDGSGRILRSLGSQDIDSWSVPITWDGRDDSGLAVPPGTYIIRLKGSNHGPGLVADDGPTASLTTSEASIQVTIANLPPVRVSSLHGGFSGAMLAPDALILPPGSFQLSTGGYAFIDLGDGASKARIPVWTGLRVGGFPYPGAEMALSAMLTSYPGYTEYPPMDGISAAGSIKSPLLTGDQLAAALIVRVAAATYIDESVSGWPPSWDGTARYPGVGAGLVFQWTPGDSPERNPARNSGGGRQAGTGRVFASAEMNAGRFYPGWGDDDGPGVWEVPGFFAWPYFRAGLETLVDLKTAGTLSLQSSAAARGQPVGTPQGFRPPLSLAGELAWYLPEAPYVLHAYVIGEWEGFYSWYFAGGAGISLLY